MAVLQQPYMYGPANVNTPASVATGGNQIVIDGTPVRGAMLAIGAAVGSAALRWAGFKFNVGV